MEISIWIAVVGIVVSLLGSATVVGWRSGIAQGRTNSLEFRLSQIEKDHSGLMTGLAEVRTTVKDIAEDVKELVRKIEYIRTHSPEVR